MQELLLLVSLWDDEMTTTARTIQSIDYELRRIVHRLVQEYQPQRIILYGSFAKGKQNEDSDIDLLIIKETTETPLEWRIRVRRLVFQPKRKTPFSPLVLTPTELAQRLAMKDPFYCDIIAHGKVLYAGN
jgi:predicted nucleotidyltransferase